MTECNDCTCRATLGEVKHYARQEIVRELMAQISDKERQIAHLERLVDMLTLDLAIARGEITFVNKNEKA